MTVGYNRLPLTSAAYAKYLTMVRAVVQRYAGHTTPSQHTPHNPPIHNLAL
jgi:hypothetical protein